MSESIVYNMDCMEYMRTLPDKAFDLAIVDPPYGDGNGGSAKRFGGMFGAVYGENTRARIADAHERERETRRSITDSAEDSISTKVNQMKRAAKKSWRGMLPQRRSIFKSFSASHATRSFGAETIFLCRRRAVF
jgi:DNA modification methylase